MGKQEKHTRSGYCNWCAHNTDHGIYSSGFLSDSLQWFVRTFSGQTGYGPWYCSGCRRVVVHLVPILESYVQEGGDEIGSGLPSGGPQRADIGGSHGLVTDSESVLKDSNSRYSEKFRTGIVRRIIEGSTTFKQVSEELSVPRKELWSWIVERFGKQQFEIGQCKQTIKSLQTELDCVRALDPDAVSEDSQWTTVIVGPSAADLRRPGPPGLTMLPSGQERAKN